MPIHPLKLLSRREVARNTIEFNFEKPTGFQFKPGQYGGFTLINPPETDAGGITRRFSLLSAPDEVTITITTRIQQSAFKRVLRTMSLNESVKFAGPTGAFTLHDDRNIPAVFLAGGIGIAPFYSMIKDAAVHLPQQKIILFYGNQTREDAAYFDELTELAKTYSNFIFIPLLANPHEQWSGESGYITHTLIRKYVPDLSLPIYYVCGSPTMVTTIQELLVEMDIDEGKIKIEDFPGY